MKLKNSLQKKKNKNEQLKNKASTLKNNKIHNKTTAFQWHTLQTLQTNMNEKTSTNCELA